MFENQTAPAKWRQQVVGLGTKSGETILGLRRLFFMGIMQHVWSCPPISGDHQYVSAQVGPVEAFHIESCPLTEHPVELRLFQISLFFSHLSIAAMSSQLLDSGFAKDKYDNWLSEFKWWNGFFPGGTETWTDEAPLWWRWKDSLARNQPPWTETQILTGGQVYNISNVFDGPFKAIIITIFVSICVHPYSYFVQLSPDLYLVAWVALILIFVWVYDNDHDNEGDNDDNNDDDGSMMMMTVTMMMMTMSGTSNQRVRWSRRLMTVFPLSMERNQDQRLSQATTVLMMMTTWW